MLEGHYDLILFLLFCFFLGSVLTAFGCNKEKVYSTIIFGLIGAFVIGLIAQFFMGFF